MTVLHRIFFLLTTLIFVSSCGFKPLYGKKETEIYKQLSLIKVRAIKDRIGQILKYRLEDLFNYGSKNYKANDSSKYKYELKVNLNLKKNILSLRKDSTLRRQEIQLIANYQLFDMVNNKLLKEFKSTAYVPYSVPHEANYKSLSALEAEESSIKRALEITAQDITMNLNIYFQITNNNRSNNASNDGSNDDITIASKGR